MASHAYPQAGAGPSSYYQQSPPPHHVYGNHSPGPRPNYHYSYPVPPPHLNSHQPPQFQQSQSRANHRHNVGGGGGTSYGSRGTHHYNNYHPTQHHQHNQFPHSHVNPQLGPHPQQQHVPYSPQSAKYNHSQPYSPSYHYPSPTAPVFTPSWQTQQPISPLPKQLSMPPPQMPPSQNVQAFYEPSLAPPPGLTQSPQIPVVSIAPSSEDEIKTEPPAPSTPTAGSPVELTSSPRPESLLPSQAPYSSTYSQMGTISISDAVTSASPPSSPGSSSYVSPSRRTVANPVAQWAIWSRRPQDPSHAPSIIISPRARPPPDVVQQAIDLKTPPQSQPSSPSRSATILPAVVGESLVVVQEENTFGTAKDEESSPTPPSEDVELSTGSSSVTSSSVVWSSQDSSTVPSSSVTEINDTPIVPGSPASSNTSLSLAGIPLKDVKEPQTKLDEENKATAVEPEPEAPSPPFVVSLSTSAMSTSVSSSSSTVVSGSSVSSSTVISHESLATTTDPNSIQTSTPTPSAAARPAPATIKKSWADLLRPSTSSTPSSSASPSSGPATRNTLPTSSVVGFSIPAGSASTSSSSNPTVPVSPSEKSELIALLTSGPSPNSTTAATNLRPRGIVNSGNMCYANSVLQVLVYCVPFQKLFVELGKVLPGITLVDSGAGSSGSLVNGFGSGSSSTSGSTSVLANGLNGKEKDATGMTPLVDATVEFLGEFMDDKKTKSKAKKQVHSKKGSVHVNGSGSTSGGGSKGKEKETRVPNGNADDGSEADWDAYDSFLPTYVYDAMKSKKRFDHMKGGHQEDAEEFFGFYLETLEEELLSLLHAVNPPKSTNTAAAAAVEEKEEAAPPDDGWMEVGKRNRTVITRMIKATESPITRIFSGRFRTTVRAPGQKDSATVDDWNLLRLDIQRDHIHTIQDALSSISHPQSVQLTQSARPGIIIEGQQQSLIEVLPPILVLQMKRFGYGSTGVAKVGKQVRFGPELEIGPDLMAPAAKKAHPQRYKLFGALYHHGLSASGGHYTLDVLHPNRYPGSGNTKTREGWVRIDDELVSDVRHDDVFGAYERDDARCAYLLFYRRI